MKDVSGQQKSPRFSLIGMACLGLVGCQSNLAPKEDQIIPISRDEQRKTNFGKIFGEGFLSFGGETKYDPTLGKGLQINPFLWQASLEVFSFIPLASSDAVGGVLLTEWYPVPHRSQERLKVMVRISDRQLRVDGVKVTVYKQILTKGEWTLAPSDPSLEKDLEEIILIKARELKVQSKR